MKPATSVLLGQRLGHIRLVDVLGEGGMGAVYVGFDDTLQRRVAVKAIRSEYRLHDEAKARFLREPRILSQLNHPHICTVYDFVEEADADFLVLELVEGRSLARALEGELSSRERMAVADQLLEVLAAVHAKGVIHRDLKPDNVMLTPSGDIKVLDFGLARSAGPGMVASPTTPTLGLDETGADLAETVAPTSAASGSHVETRLGTVLGTAAT